MGFKMVRDNHQKHLTGVVSGVWRTSPDPLSSLLKKLGEEYSEFAENRSPDELFDIRDVLEELIELMDPKGTAEAEHYHKTQAAGLFHDHLEWHPLPQGDVTWRQFMEGR